MNFIIKFWEITGHINLKGTRRGQRTGNHEYDSNQILLGDTSCVSITPRMAHYKTAHGNVSKMAKSGFQAYRCRRLQQKCHGSDFWALTERGFRRLSGRRTQFRQRIHKTVATRRMTAEQEVLNVHFYITGCKTSWIHFSLTCSLRCTGLLVAVPDTQPHQFKVYLWCFCSTVIPPSGPSSSWSWNTRAWTEAFSSI